MHAKIKPWQWPNVLAIDAALIAVLWQAALVASTGTKIGWTAQAVLGLSVWLTYVADRLYDVQAREALTLLSLRHQFAKRHRRALWRVWFVLLLVNLLLATQLTSTQLAHGGLLLALCLFYTLLNQKLSRRFFPKEICVALIYAGGVVVFVPEAWTLGFFVAFGFLCLLNCLIIGAKEKGIDAELRVHSIAPRVAERWLTPLALLGAGITMWHGTILDIKLAISFGLLGTLHCLRERIEVEAFRVLADSTLLLGAVIAIVT